MTDFLKGLFDESFEMFLRRERNLILNDTNERCGRLAMHLQNAADRNGMEQYYADMDYNRNRGDVKRIIGEVEGANIPIIADLILHSRAELPNDNLIAIEMKKSGRDLEDKEDDRHRLRALTMPDYDRTLWPTIGNGPEYVHGYHLGIFIDIDIRRAGCLLEEYREGKLVTTETRSFREEAEPVLAIPRSQISPPRTTIRRGRTRSKP